MVCFWFQVNEEWRRCCYLGGGSFLCWRRSKSKKASILALWCLFGGGGMAWHACSLDADADAERCLLLSKM